jgi:FG-GAP-like repeat
MGSYAGNAPLTFPVAANPAFVAVGDFNFDGRPDLAVAVTNAGTFSIAVLLGLGNGQFAPPLSFLVGSGPSWIVTADLTLAGRLDLVVANIFSGTLSVLLNTTHRQLLLSCRFLPRRSHPRQQSPRQLHPCSRAIRSRRLSCYTEQFMPFVDTTLLVFLGMGISYLVDSVFEISPRIADWIDRGLSR